MKYMMYDNEADWDRYEAYSKENLDITSNELENLDDFQSHTLRIVCDIRNRDADPVVNEDSGELEFLPLDGSGCCLMDQSSLLGGGMCVIYVGVTDTSQYTAEELEDITIVTVPYVQSYFMTNAQFNTLQTTTYDLTNDYMIDTSENELGIVNNYPGFEAFDCTIGEQSEDEKEADVNDIDADGDTEELIGG